MLINGLGGLVSGVMTVIIAYTKFADGAWVILVAIPAIIAVLLRIHRHYADVAKRLRDPSRHPGYATVRQRAIIAVDRPGSDDMYAAAYAASLRPSEIRIVHVGGSDADVLSAWARMGVAETIEFLPARHGLVQDLRAYVADVRRECEPGEVVNVVVPESVTGTGAGYYLFRRPVVQLLKARLLAEPDVVVSNVTMHEGFEPPRPSDTRTWRHVAVVLVSAAHNATFAALRYAHSLHADELHCVHVNLDEAEGGRVAREWEVLAPGSPLTLLESPYRQMTEPLVAWIRSLLDPAGGVISVVVPEFVVSKWWENLLHNQTALELKRTFLFEPSVVVCGVPYRLKPERATAANWY